MQILTSRRWIDRSTRLEVCVRRCRGHSSYGLRPTARSLPGRSSGPFQARSDLRRQVLVGGVLVVLCRLRSLRCLGNNWCQARSDLRRQAVAHGRSGDLRRQGQRQSAIRATEAAEPRQRRRQSAASGALPLQTPRRVGSGAARVAATETETISLTSIAPSGWAWQAQPRTGGNPSRPRPGAAAGPGWKCVRSAASESEHAASPFESPRSLHRIEPGGSAPCAGPAGLRWACLLRACWARGGCMCGALPGATGKRSRLLPLPKLGSDQIWAGGG